MIGDASIMISKNDRAVDIYVNKSTAIGENIRPWLSNIPSPYDICLGFVDAVMTGSKLNLIKNLWKGGGGNPTTLTVSSLVRGVGALKPEQYARLCQMR